MTNKAVVGVFSYMDDVTRAIGRVRKGDYDYRVYSPFPSHDIDHAAHTPRSPIRFVSFVGAVTGLTLGFTLAIMCSLDWPLRVSAKDIVSIPGFVVIGYECTILFGAIFTLLSLMHFCRIPDILRKVGYDPRFTRDKFGVVVSARAEGVDEVQQFLLDCGAEEVEIRDGL